MSDFIMNACAGLCSSASIDLGNAFGRAAFNTTTHGTSLSLGNNPKI